MDNNSPKDSDKPKKNTVKQSKKKTKKSNAGRKLFDGKNFDMTVKKLEEAFAIDSTVKGACAYAEITTTAFYKWIKRNPKYLVRFNWLREHPVLKARRAVVGALDDPEIALRYLERKCKDEFSTKQVVSGEVLTGELPEAHKKELSKVLRANGDID